MPTDPVAMAGTTENRLRGQPGRPGLRGRLAGRGAECPRMGPAVVLGQHLADLAWPVGDSTVADLAARNRELGDGHRKAAGI